MKRKHRQIYLLPVCIIIFLVIVFFVKFFSILTKNIDKSKILTESLVKKTVSYFNPQAEYIYWGNDQKFLKEIINFYLPANKYIYEEAAITASTVPGNYLTYYNAITISDNTGAASVALKADEEAKYTLSTNDTVFKSDYSKLQLSDYSFLVNEFYTVDRTTYIDETLLNAETFLAQDFTIDKSKDVILIYHTHSQEAFADSIEGDPDTSIVAVGQYLSELLSQKYGYKVIHSTAVYDLKNGKLDRSKAYTYAEDALEQILEENPDIEVIIDLHRDGLDGDKMTTNINGKETARIMFFNGLSRTIENGEIDYLYNTYRSENLAISFQAQLVANQKYPGLMRHIYLKGYQYNLHFKPRSMLIEAGSQKNTLEEMMNAMEPLADIINTVLSTNIVVSQ